MVSRKDDEQLEKLKRWWDENGTSTLAAIVLGVGGVLGYQAWENSVRESGEAASAMYEDLAAASASLAVGGDESMEATAKSLATQLREEHGGSTYAVFAALHLAKFAVGKSDYPAAAAELGRVLGRDMDESLEVIVRLRLARVLLAQEKPEQALATLEDAPANDAQRSSLEEVKGDAYVAMGELDKARDAYLLAMDHLEEDTAKPLLSMKLADIPAADLPLARDAEAGSEESTDEGSA